MKTNKIYKIITIIMILVISMFTFGCGESQEEKFDKLKAEHTQIVNKYTNETKEIEEGNMKKKEKWIKLEESVDKYEKEATQKLNEMEKVARGNEKLEKKVIILQKKLKYTLSDIRKILKEMHDEI